ncbi:alpha/beta fold hydrolase [Bacillus sp. FJAT-27245]|uniref:alpha/beta fold hydrolase n=1 Tax=Bacillus sp. FJAT-27245 TaxID=1684144 RepID=UPI0006A7F087|nr:alpha/beta hydrolase [Bacillus sp. FJAT-27245]
MWQREMISTGRGTFEVFVCGSGEPLCITHLYSEFNELGNYFADMFNQSFQVYLVNLKEAGSSSKVSSEKELSMEETALDLEALRSALNIKKWGFAGHSTGGMLGLVYAFLFPHSLTKVMIGGASATNGYMEHSGSIYCGNNPLNPRLKELLSILKSAEPSREEKMKAGREWTEMSLNDPGKFEKYFSKPSSGKVVQKRLDYFSYTELPAYDIREKIRQLRIPAIVYCGEHDSQCPVDFSKEIAELIPDSKLYIFQKSNHVPFLEESAEFQKMVGDFSKLKDSQPLSPEGFLKFNQTFD